MIRNIIKNYIKPRENRIKNVEYINSFDDDDDLLYACASLS